MICPICGNCLFLKGTLVRCPTIIGGNSPYKDISHLYNYGSINVDIYSRYFIARTPEIELDLGSNVARVYLFNKDDYYLLKDIKLGLIHFNEIAKTLDKIKRIIKLKAFL